MIRILLPILLVIGFVLAQWWFMHRRTQAMLATKSRPLDDLLLGKHTAKLAEAAGVPEVRVRLLTMKAINGLAMPDGGIYISTGLYETYLKRQINAAELASVVAHELGHVALGHTRRRVVDVAGSRVTQVVLGTFLARFIPYFGWYIAAWLASLFVAKLSRADEFEADRFGAALMVKAGIGTEPQAMMLEKLLALTEGDALPGKGTGAAPGWLDSHPPVEERVKRIRALGAGWEREPAPEGT